jgi:hypothetical protein
MKDNCQDIRDKIAEALAGDAQDLARDEVATHLAACPDCRAYSEDLAKDDELLDVFAGSADETVSRLEVRVMQAIQAREGVEQAKDTRSRAWHRRPLFGFAMAAAAVLLLIVLLVLMDTTGGGSVVWADVIARVEEAQDFICRRIEKRSGEPPMEIIEYRSAAHGLRQDIYQEGSLQAVQYIIPEEKIMYALVHRDRTYMQSRLSAEQVAELQRQSNAREIVRNFRDHSYEELGRRRIDGVMAEGIEITDIKEWVGVFERGTWRLWVDVETQWPVRIELEGVAAGGSVRKTYTLKDFQWNPTLSAEDFDVVIPDNYKLIADLQQVVADEEHTIAGLRSYAKLVRGRYPSSLSLATAIAEAEKFIEKHDSYDEQAGRDIESLFELRSACNFYAELLTGDKEVAYFGDRVRASDFDRVLMRWKQDDGLYRVIYGDLRAETVDSTRLVELEKPR